jgi:hypothetical protein
MKVKRQENHKVRQAAIFHYNSRKKGILQIDFIVAIGIFVAIFALVIQAITVYFSNAESTSDVEILTTQTISMLGILDSGFVPASWNGTEQIDRLGIATKAYKFFIVVNNTQLFYYNQSQSPGNLANELVSFNYTSMGIRNIDINSTSIYYDNKEVPYNINADNITFRTDIGKNTVKIFTVYFDDDSNFTSRSVSISGSNYIRETIQAALPFNLIQYKKTAILNSSNYTAVRNALGAKNFRLTIHNIEKKPYAVFFDYGGEVPRAGNIVAIQRYALFQNSTAGINEGRLTVRMW